MMHVEGYYSVKSEAFRNRNPGNLEHADGKMQVYGSVLEGFTALLNDIADNAGKTLSEFLDKYAPDSENDTNLYINVVSRLSAIGPGEVL